MDRIKPGHNAISSSERMREFSENIEIEGLPYIFRGAISIPKKLVNLSLRMPSVDGDVARLMIEHGVPKEYARDGVIGYVAAHKSQNTVADIYITGIRSYTDKLPEDLQYHHARIGRFLMDNLLALADIRGWKVEAIPASEGRLSNRDLYSWLQNKGFSTPELSPVVVRQPQEPDMIQPIAKHIKAKNSKSKSP